MSADVYTRVTDRIIVDLERSVRPWVKPWNANHTTGHIVRPLRYNGVAYRGINIITPWSEAQERGFISPFWLT